MPVPSAITDLSQTAGSNYPSGGDSPSVLDDVQRAHASFIALLRDGKGLTNPVTLASATTTDIGGQNAQFVEISGTTTITSFGTIYNGPRFLRFTGALTLTHNATTLNLPGAANITTAAGDTCIAVPNQALNGWNVVSYQYAANASAPFALKGANSDITSLSAITSINGGQLAGLRNKIINGGMDIAQRGTSFAAIGSTAYSLDRWRIDYVTSAVVTVSQQTDVPSDNEFQNSLRVAITTADASIVAGDVLALRQRIEGYNARDLIGRTFTLSFWVRSSKTGVHCVSFRNSGGDRSYISEYTISVANTWERKSITVAGGLITAGTWDWAAGIGFDACFTLAAGSTFQTTAGAWQTGGFFSTANQVNCLDTIGNIFAITGVQLEIGSVATPFEQRPYGLELALCQRYYSVNEILALTVTNSTSSNFPVEMRVAPTLGAPSLTSGTGATYTPLGGGASKRGYFQVNANSLIATATLSAAAEL